LQHYQLQKQQQHAFGPAGLPPAAPAAPAAPMQQQNMGFGPAGVFRPAAVPSMQQQQQQLPFVPAGLYADTPAKMQALQQKAYKAYKAQQRQQQRQTPLVAAAGPAKAGDDDCVLVRSVTVSPAVTAAPLPAAAAAPAAAPIYREQPIVIDDDEGEHAAAVVASGSAASSGAATSPAVGQKRAREEPSTGSGAAEGAEDPTPKRKRVKRYSWLKESIVEQRMHGAIDMAAYNRAFAEKISSASHARYAALFPDAVPAPAAAPAEVSDEEIREFEAMLAEEDEASGTEPDESFAADTAQEELVLSSTERELSAEEADLIIKRLTAEDDQAQFFVAEEDEEDGEVEEGDGLEIDENPPTLNGRREEDEETEEE
jgi:hypothetical protein